MKIYAVSHICQSVIQFKACPVQLSYKVAENDKVKMAETVKTRRETGPSHIAPSAANEGEKQALPELRYLSDDEGWTTFEEPLLYVYAGKGPYVGRLVLSFLLRRSTFDIFTIATIWHSLYHYQMTD